MINKLIKIGNKNLNTISFGIVYLFMILFALIYSSSIVSSSVTDFRNTLTIYLLMNAVIFAFINKTHPLFNISLLKGTIVYLGFFFVSVLFFSLIQSSNPYAMSVAFNLPMYSFLYAFVVSFSEDIPFAVFLPNYMSTKMGRSKAMIFSAFLFSIFHFGVYSAGSVGFVIVLSRLAFAFAMNLLFQFLNLRYGITASAGVHSAWNMYILGLL
jgi:membrane protease YdiL (CAAX protease family)